MPTVREKERKKHGSLVALQAWMVEGRGKKANMCATVFMKKKQMAYEIPPFCASKVRPESILALGNPNRRYL